MVVTISQSHILINEFSKLSINKQVWMAAPVVQYVLSPFEGDINPVDPHGIILYLQSTNDIYEEDYKLDI